MEKIDLRLQIILDKLRDRRMTTEDLPSEGIVPGAAGAAPGLLVLVQFTGATAPLEAAGLRVISRVDDIVTGQISAEAIGALAGLDSVLRIEGNLPMSEELGVSGPVVNINAVHTAPGVGTPPATFSGRGVIVGVIDSGIDFRHEAFRAPDGLTSRILAIWDQSLVAAGTESAPAPFGYGVEYNRAAINAALAPAAPAGLVRHRDGAGSGHGTHVSGIAAGKSGTITGMAPEADIIMVRNSGGSINSNHAIDYIFTMAAALGRPCVINQSQGFNAGPHDGTTATELMIDKMLGTPGRAYVKSAGNSAGANWHWGVTIAAGATSALTVQFDDNVQTDALVDMWYSGSTMISVVLTDPTGQVRPAQAQPAAAGSATTADVMASGNRIVYRTETANPFNRDNNFAVEFQSGTAAAITSGTWTLAVTNTGASAAELHAWVERNNAQTIHFGATPNGSAATISTPGTAREVIAAGSFVTTAGGGAAVGAISDFSSRGPTRDGRIKPDITAPGELVTSARASTATMGAGLYHALQGTSMAAPHVTGAIACLLQKRPTLTQEQIRRGLAATAKTDANTGAGTAVPNNTWGAGKLDVRALLEYDFPAATTRTWARIRSTLYNWTEGATPPSFEVISNENGRAVIELAWGSTDIPVPPALDPAAPLRYYNTGTRLDVSITKADGTAMPIVVPEQTITLRDNRAVWTMPQVLWDGYREELKKARKTPPTSQMRQMLYYRVRFEPSGGTSAVIWPDDSSFNASPLNNRMNIIALALSPITQVVPDVPAMQAMPRHAAELDWMWRNLPENNPDRQSLVTLFSHRFFTNSVETAIRGKILTLWVEAGPARQRVHTMLDRMFRTPADLEMTVLKQPCIKDRIMLIDHLLELARITPHPDIAGVRVAEQLLDDVLQEIMDPNGQVNQGSASTCAPTGIQTLMINANASEYVRLQRGLMSVGGQATLANGDVVEPPAGIFRVALYAGAQANGFTARTNAELAFQATLLKYAKQGNFPRYDPDAPPDGPSGINTVFQATIRQGLTFDEIKRAMDALFNRPFTKRIEAAPSAALRTGLLAALTAARDPLLTVLHWNAPASDATTGLHAVVALRTEAGRIFFKNPQYSGTGAPATMVQNSTVANPPRRLDDPAQALESMGDNDLTAWVRGYYQPA